LFLLLLIGAAGVLRCAAQTTPAASIETATEYEFQTVDGAAYVVEGRGASPEWATVAGPIFGDGGKSRALLPARAAATMKEFRVRAVPVNAYGPATSQLGDKTLLLNDEDRRRMLIFFPMSHGVRRGYMKLDEDHACSFVWKVRRTSAAAETVELTYFDGSKGTVDLEFSNGLLGTYQLRDRDATGVVKVMEAGPFSLHKGIIQTGAEDNVLPESVGGLSVMFSEAGALTRFDFSNNHTVSLLMPDNTTEIYSYTYTRHSPDTGSLRLEAPGMMPQDYQLRMNSQATGNFNRLPMTLPGGGLVPGLLPGAGIIVIPTTPVVVNSATGPPTSLSGKTLELSGDDPVTLTFNSDGTGTSTREDSEGSVEVTPFTYNYTPTDDDEATLSLIYPGAETDRVEEYDLDFDDNGGGSYNSRTYEGGERATSGSGSFAAP
jgi:hypothetical protein